MLTWIDLAILIIFLFYAVEGYALGAIPATLDLVQFTLSFFLGLKFYGLLSGHLATWFSLPAGIANAAGFFVIAFFSEFILSMLFKRLLRSFLKENFLQSPKLKTYNHALGILPGALSGIILVMFIITVLTSLPLSPFLRKTIAGGVISPVLLANSQLIEKQVSQVFGKAATDTINFLTVEPESNETVSLHFTDKNGAVDTAAEDDMFLQVNNEREKAGFTPLIRNDGLTSVARAHAKDMLSRGYFSHYTPEGLSPFDRMNNAGIEYNAAGENLAFAPNTALAMQGLMNSPGHRANILSKDFGKLGIGVIDAGIYGEMFVQEFTN